MWKKMQVVFVVLLCIVVILQAQNRRWRLKIEHTAPKMITITEPDGMRKNYWYIRYKIINDTEQDVRQSMIQIRLVVDQNEHGVLEGEVPNVFYQAKIPEGVDKVTYLKKLQNFYDVDIPIVRQEILDQTGIWPKLTAQEKKILDLLDSKKPKSPMDLLTKSGMSYHEIRTILDSLVIRNLALPEGILGSSTFLEGRTAAAIFLIHGQESNIKVGESVNGWQLISYSKNRATLKKNNVVISLSQGMLIEHNYIKSDKIILDKHSPLLAGSQVRGVYKGQVAGKGKQKYSFASRSIPKKSSQEGIAIFCKLPARIDFMAVIISGLVDPITIRNGKTFIEEEVWMAGYNIVEESQQQKIIPLYQRWEVLRTKEIQKP